jgi:light-regulated signal transduction histidine kinase (bacteriophytochrome)
VPLKNANGEIISFLEISSNITERKFAELEIIKLNSKLEKEVLKRREDIKSAVSELEAFTYSVSHDLRAPLRAITSFADLLNEEYGADLDKEAKRYLGIIKRGTKQMAQLIDDLLQFSKVGRIELKKKVFDPMPIIMEIIKKEKEVDMSSSFILNELPSMYGDSNTMALVFSNLILNAVKFSREVDAPLIHIGAIEKNREVIYYVKDNGVGFDMRYSDKLFKVFQRLHSTQQFEGTGVGLAIVSRIIYKHGGRVWAESSPGFETCFYFTLPQNSSHV